MREPACYSDLDSRRFGKRIYRADVENPDDASRIDAIAVRDHADMVISRCSAERLDVVHALESGGHRLMDTLVYYGGPTAAFADAPIAPFVREARQDDLPSLEAVARDAFMGYGGHYHADPRLDPSLATLGYVEWCLTSVGRPRFTVWVAEQEGAVAGFLAARHDEGVSEITLNGVATRFQRRGLYDALLKTCGRTLYDRAVPEMCISTQLTNVAPQKVWVRSGLTPRRALYTFHKWYLP